MFSSTYSPSVVHSYHTLSQKIQTGAAELPQASAPKNTNGPVASEQLVKSPHRKSTRGVVQTRKA
jgi:hypothetical protein